jgi:hypothetical protein
MALNAWQRIRSATVGLSAQEQAQIFTDAVEAKDFPAIDAALRVLLEKHGRNPEIQAPLLAAVNALAKGHPDTAITVANLGVGDGLSSHTNNPYVRIPSDLQSKLRAKVKEIAVHPTTPASVEILTILRYEPDEWAIVVERLAQSDLAGTIELVEIEIDLCWDDKINVLMKAKLTELQQRQNAPKPAQ